ncbi:MAG: acyl--CoA ligase, partial [Oscillibacter sp.]|nr:acyl--CoA ligase [Oscillibacter sp.]
MPITDLLERNSKLYGDQVCLVEMNPDITEAPRVTWKEYELVQPTAPTPYLRQITWSVFDEKANRVANLLLSRGIQKGQKVAILLMNCLEWLPIYFGVLKTGAVAVPLNFRYTADEIEYCLKLADTDVLFFGPEFIGRVEEIVPTVGKERILFFVGQSCPSFAESYNDATANCSSAAPKILIEDTDEAAIYYSSGTTGFPKAILLDHTALLQSARMEAKHHATTHEDVFLCIPPLYHTGAKMHWFGSLYTGSKAVLLKSNNPKSLLEAVSREGCTIVWLLVPWCQDLLAALDRGDLKLEDYKLDQWRLMHIGAQPVPPSLIRRWMKYFPHHKYDTNYGLSESTGPGCVHLGMNHIDKVGAIGVPGFGWKCKIV